MEHFNGPNTFSKTISKDEYTEIVVYLSKCDQLITIEDDNKNQIFLNKQDCIILIETLNDLISRMYEH